tara:strand:+ start:677 stop:1102 length:426 start_codon:yes stop_codon:yes gene_type:complete
MIGITLLISSVYMSFLKKDDSHFIRFYNLLNEEQKNIYESIILERVLIYITGMVLGIMFALFYYINNKNDKYLICKVLSIIYVVKLGFYKLFPKSPLMLYSLTTKQQTDAWADIYSEMKNRWITSLVVGFFGYLFLSFGIK